MSKSIRHALILTVIILILSACNLPSNAPATEEPNAVFTAAAQTVQAQLTQSVPFSTPTLPPAFATSTLSAPTQALPSSTVSVPASPVCDQARFIKELHRVARRVVCLTTPNRWFPVEVHTSVPLLHWLPPRAYRAVLAFTRLKFFADESNLNLLSAADLRWLCQEQAIVGAFVEGVRLLGWRSNLLLFVDKAAAAGRRPQ